MDKPLNLLAAGSLAQALAGLGPVMGRPVLGDFGPSGGLRARIEGGAAWDVFASADTDHPARLHAAGLGTVPRILCHNTMALILRPGLAGADAVDLMTRGDLRLGMSTPANDPSGDYALSVLNRIDPALGATALRLTGGRESARAPAGRNTYAWLLTSGAADMFLTYRSNAIAARRDTPALTMLDVPERYQISATYALTTRTGAGPEVAALADILLSGPLQSRLTVLGFSPATHFVSTGELA